MSRLNINDPKKTPQKKIALFQLAFRPFFLGAGLSAVILMSLWLLILNKVLTVPHYPATLWHAHEMIFGYTAVVIVGFLLTAIRNWTGVQTIQNGALALLAFVWLLARIAPWLSVPPLAVAIIDGAFLPLAGVAVAIPIIRIKQYTNLIFIPIILALAIANILFHLEMLNITTTANMGIRFATALIILLMVIMGTRVIPFFISRGANLQPAIKSYKIVDITGNISVVAWMFSSTFYPYQAFTAIIALIASALIFIRLITWYTSKLWAIPMLWILYIGFAFIPLGLALKGLAGFSIISDMVATHALTAGAIGILTLGMVSRVSLGHSGRDIQHNGLILSSFIFVILAALTRISLIIPAIAAHSMLIYSLSGILWIAAFSAFLIYFTKIFFLPRADGMAG